MLLRPGQQYQREIHEQMTVVRLEIPKCGWHFGSEPWGRFVGYHRPSEAAHNLIELTYQLVLSFSYSYKPR